MTCPKGFKCISFPLQSNCVIITVLAVLNLKWLIFLYTIFCVQTVAGMYMNFVKVSTGV